MAVYGAYVGLFSVQRDAYEAEMSFYNPATLDSQKRTGTFSGLDFEHVSGVEDAVWRNLAQYYVQVEGELEGYYLSSATVRRVDVVSFIPSPDTSI